MHRSSRTAGRRRQHDPGGLGLHQDGGSERRCSLPDIQAWIDSPLGANLADSLRQSRFARRHGVLTFDSSEPEYSERDGTGGTQFVPTTSLTLPPEIDMLWCLIGPVVLRYDGEGWHSLEGPQPDITPATPPAN